jgi:hypothetical protein
MILIEIDSGTQEKNKANEQAYGSASMASAKSSGAQSPTESPKAPIKTDPQLRRGRLCFWLLVYSQSALDWCFSGLSPIIN